MRRLMFAAAAFVPTVATTALAADFDGSAPFVCAAVDIASCAPGGDCQRATAESINAPRFLSIDLGARAITGKRPNGEVLTARIDTVREGEQRLVLQGVDEPLTWSLIIAKPAGTMTLTAGNDEQAVVIFGACIQQ